MNLTREEIQNMPAGRKMRELVATRVMKWRLLEPLDTFDDRPRLYWFDQDTKTTIPVDSWMPDENLLNSFSALRRFDLWNIYRGTQGYEVKITIARKPVVTTIAADLNVAICRAALIAVMEAK